MGAGYSRDSFPILREPGGEVPLGYLLEGGEMRTIKLNSQPLMLFEIQ